MRTKVGWGQRGSGAMNWDVVDSTGRQQAAKPVKVLVKPSRQLGLNLW